MSNRDEVSTLELQHSQLLLSLRLPDSVLQGGAPEFLKHLDLNFARQLLGTEEPWGRENVFGHAPVVSDVLLASDDAKKLYLASEIDLLRKVKETGEEVVHKGPFDLLEAVFPVKVRGHLVHIIRSGKYRAAAFMPKEVKDLAFLCGRPIQVVDPACAAVPVYGRAEADAMLATHRKLRDAAALALKEHVKARGLAGQHLQAERMAALGTLADGMAHHFSNLLSVILGYGSLVLDKGQLDAESAEALKRVNDAAQRGRRFTEEILSLTGGQDEEDAHNSIHERLDGVLPLLQARLPAGASVKRDFAAARDGVLAPPAVVHQIIFNLLAAALDSLPRGGTLAVHTSNCSEERELGAQDCIKIVVADGDAKSIGNGHVTSARSALDTMAGESVGPKLTSLFGQIGRLDGTVTVESSEDGSATRVEIILPLSGAASVAPEKKIKRRLAPSSVWVVEDDPNVCEMCRRVLSAEGHTVEEFSSGESLVRRLQGGGAKPDLLMVDFNLPDQNGLEIISWLREAGHRTPVIFTTAFGPEHPQVGKALKHRKAFLLRKPFTFRDLADQVTIALGETLIGA